MNRQKKNEIELRTDSDPRLEYIKTVAYVPLKPDEGQVIDWFLKNFKYDKSHICDMGWFSDGLGDICYEDNTLIIEFYTHINDNGLIMLFNKYDEPVCRGLIKKYLAFLADDAESAKENLYNLGKKEMERKHERNN